VTLQIINYKISKNNFEKASQHMEETIDDLSRQSVEEMMDIRMNSARDLLKEIKIAVGSSLQPGESHKFKNLAKQQIEINQIDEFAFYGPQGALKISSNDMSGLKKLPNDVMQEAKQTEELVIRGKKQGAESMRFFLPLFVDADLRRMAPDYEVGDYYGTLFVEINKDRINQIIQNQRSSKEEAMKNARQFTKDALYGGLKVSSIVLIAFLVAISAICLPFVHRIIRPINRTKQRLKDVADQVYTSSKQVSSSSQSTAEGASKQASSLEETSSSLEEMAAQTRQNADNSEKAEKMVKDTAAIVESGVSSMEKMNIAMLEIKEASSETYKIIKTIDDIAFQTNLLALNAAVEASRAGDAGKGFAVVAEEVRNLAQQSAEAAQNTSALIEKSQAKAENGVSVSDEVSQQLASIQESSSKITTLIADISAASKEQAQGIEQLNTAVSEMDKVVQKNASDSEESASAAEELSAQADEMHKMVTSLEEIVSGHRSEGTHEWQEDADDH